MILNIFIFNFKTMTYFDRQLFPPEKSYLCYNAGSVICSSPLTQNTFTQKFSESTKHSDFALKKPLCVRFIKKSKYF